MKDDSTWAPCLAELPGIEYVPPEGVGRPRLATRHATPRVSHHEYDGSASAWLSWETRDGSTSASPAQRYVSEWPTDEAPTPEVVRHLHAGLALPGTPSDYHFAIQHVIDALWKRRRTDPEAISPIEGLCLLDTAIVEAHRFKENMPLAPNLAIRTLIKMYEGAADFDAALEVARRSLPYWMDNGDIERLEEKRGRLTEEGP